MAVFSVYRALSIAIMSVLAVGAGYLGYRVLKSEIAASVYKERLTTLATDYEALRGRYNDAVRSTAVTELVVEGGKLSVEVRSRAGVLQTIATPFDPSREIFVDYAVVGGRLLIRRVFDASTPPDKGLVVDSALAAVDWERPETSHGKAVYRTLGEGRWVISVSGNGALALTKSTHDDPMPLSAVPEIKSYEQELAGAKTQIEAIGWSDVWRSLMGRKD